MLSDACLYSEHRSMQVSDTEKFLSSVVQKMEWGSHPEQEVVMDIGCGPGSSTLKLLLPTFPRVGKIVAIDVIPDMIEFARKNNVCKKIEYHVANIEDRRSISNWTEKISKVISIYCFNWLGDQEEAFRNIYHVLRPGGQAALLFVLSTSFWDSYKLHLDNPKWKKYLENANQCVPESHRKKHRTSYYLRMLQDIGFIVQVCEDEDRTHVYPNDDDCRAAAFSRSALSSYIPEELKSEFKEDLFQGFLKYNGRSADGRPMLFYTVLSLLIKKPA